MISREKAAEVAAKYKATPAFIERVAAFIDETGRGKNPYDVLTGMGLSAYDLMPRYKAWARKLRPELAEADTASELATPSGDVLADTAVRPAWEPWTAAEDPDAHRDQADYSDTPNDEGDDQQ